MRDLAKELEQAGPRMEVQWDPARMARGEAGMLARKRRRAQGRRAGLAIALALCAVGGWVRLRPVTRTEPVAAQLAQPGERVVELDTRSHAVLEVNTEAEVIVTAGQPQVHLARGRVRVVVDEPEFHYGLVHAGRIRIAARAARFAVERAEQTTLVRVTEGEAIVLHDKETRVLTAGTEAHFADQEPASEPAHVVELPASPERRPSHEPARRSWQQLASAGEYDQAYQVMSAQRAPATPDMTSLLLAADVARLSHHPAEAVARLRQALAEHRHDPRVSLAAFTLGRVLLDELGRPREAAEAFSSARASGGPLSEDALAREIEAWSRAGETEHAHALAEHYVQHFPKGYRLRAVRRFGGLDE